MNNLANADVMDTRWEYFNVLSNVTALSLKAQNLISNKLQDAPEDTRLNWLKDAFNDLNELIELAQKNHAYVGMLILSYQLKQSSTTLDAAILLENFLKVLEYPKRADHFCSNLKILSALLFITMAATTITLLPLILMSQAILSPWLVLGAIPLLLTYYFDNPFSMSRWYGEMAILEVALGGLVLFGGLYSVMPLLPVLPVLTGVLMVANVAVVGLGLLLHSVILDNKYAKLCEYQPKLKLNPRNSLKLMFNAEKPESIIQELRNIKL